MMTIKAPYFGGAPATHPSVRVGQMKRAVILGGTGVLGRVIAWRLIRAGWAVDMTGRDRTKMPADLAAAGARFIAW
jgi:NAD(P)-dependent dehydrogenase (short-subunit alcohol dehydrogenase family)